MSAKTAPAPNLLIVDDDETIQRLLEIASKDHGWQPCKATTGGDAIAALTPDIEAVVLDHGLPDMDGIKVLESIRSKFPKLPVVMLTGLNDAETAVKALRAGAADYLTKPFELSRLFELLAEVRRESKQAKTSEPTPQPEQSAGRRLATVSPLIKELFRKIEKAAALDSTILLTGESGTGKTYFAREIHRISSRASHPFITVSCPALPRELLESEFFGHEKGAFTGATASRAGRFEQASSGTLFLDEIGDLPLELQPKLLNVLQDREFFRVGGNKTFKTKARVIAATNVDLKKHVESGAFREDLYYRLNIIELRIPPLRERKSDVPKMAADLLKRIASERNRPTWKLSPAASKALQNYDWPGNIRQLANILERTTAFTDGSEISERDLLPLLESSQQESATRLDEPVTLQEAEREVLLKTFRRNGGNKAKTARELGISERSVYNLLARHGIK